VKDLILLGAATMRDRPVAAPALVVPETNVLTAQMFQRQRNNAPS
jgi:hypothetical protein